MTDRVSEEERAHRRRIWPMLTDDETDNRMAAIRVAQARTKQRMADRQCVHCGTPVETYEKVGRCVYADPCGHRQWQGQVPR